MNLGPAEIGLVLLAVMMLFGYRKLPDAARSLGRSLRIFKGEVDGLRDDPATPTPPSSRDADPSTPALVAPRTAGRPHPDPTAARAAATGTPGLHVAAGAPGERSQRPTHADQGHAAEAGHPLSATVGGVRAARSAG